MGKTIYDKEVIITELAEWISQGKTLRAFCRQEGKPNSSVIYEWINGNEEFARRMARARDFGHDEIAEECFEIADEMPPRDDFGKTDSGYVSWQKNRIWTRTQMLAKWNPKKYGDKVSLEHSVDSGLSDILKARRKKAGMPEPEADGDA